MRSLIELSAIKKSYIVGEEEFFALQGINLTIHTGEFVSI
jgi:ABC-type lipoprotein export system ATPase subunit